MVNCVYAAAGNYSVANYLVLKYFVLHVFKIFLVSTYVFIYNVWNLGLNSHALTILYVLIY